MASRFNSTRPAHTTESLLHQFREGFGPSSGPFGLKYLPFPNPGPGAIKSKIKSFSTLPLNRKFYKGIHFLVIASINSNQVIFAVCDYHE
jgi:hypothetical protein